MVFPLSNNVPPVAAEYQSIVSPALAVAESATVPVPHRDPEVPVGLSGIELIIKLAESRQPAFNEFSTK